MALAKWYKIDFHTHTPESRCFPDKKVTPKEWLKAAKDSAQNLNGILYDEILKKFPSSSRSPFNVYNGVS